MTNLLAEIRTAVPILSVAALIAIGIWPESNAPTVRTWATEMRVADWEPMEELDDSYIGSYNVPIITDEAVRWGTVTVYKCTREPWNDGAYCLELGQDSGFGPGFFSSGLLVVRLNADLPLIVKMVRETPILRVTVITP